jgi:putative protein kinase ArgK-like GTPase of G3E family
MGDRRVESSWSLAESILARPGGVRLVALAGHGGVGKSTFATRLAAALRGLRSCTPMASQRESRAWNGGRDWSAR